MVRRRNIKLGTNVFSLRRNFAALVICVCNFLNFGCAKITGSIKTISDSSSTATGPDFLNTEITDNSPIAGNGVAELNVVIHLKNSDGSVVPNYQPQYEIISGNGVTTTACSFSNDQGISAWSGAT